MFIYRESQATGIKQKDKLSLNEEILERYIELMCEYNSAEVCSYIKSIEGYRVENVLEVILKFNWFF